MKNLIIHVFLACFFAFLSIGESTAAVNVALNQPAGYYQVGTGEFAKPGFAYVNGGWDQPPPMLPNSTTMVDGVFLPEYTQWNYGTAWWDASSYESSSENYVFLSVVLSGDYIIEKFVVQADNNDDYAIDLYLNGILQATTVIPNVSGWGMMTREVILGTPITADYLVFHHPDGYAGDYLYSVSEIQAFGTPVPEPSTMLLLGSGLAGLIGYGRRRMKK